jgi:Ni,Fe-hydrogenase I large subunit
MNKIVIDPITRIEGHLRIEAQVEAGKVTDAWSSSTMFRGIEIILKNRDPRDAWAFTQRICGVCTMVHALASVRAVENALGIEIPPNARLIRSLMAGAQFLQDHIIHFYHLSALDWVDLMSALHADPAAAAQLAQSISDWPKSSAVYFRGVQERLKSFAKGGLGPFGNAYWGHPAYELPPEANLMAVAHYLEALEWQRKFIKVHAILGAKNPHLQTFLVGGVACPVDLNSQAAINDHSLAFLRDLFTEAEHFVKQVYLPDALAIASFYPQWTRIGEGVGNFLCYGDFPPGQELGSNETADLFLPGGIILNRDLSTVHPVDQLKISEYVAHSWYSYKDDRIALQPWEGETRPDYTGPMPPYEALNTGGKYSWVKAPRYDGRVMEVGPLARMLVAYASGHPQVGRWMTAAFKKLQLGPEALFSTLGRILARCIETVVLSEQMILWTDQLRSNIADGDLRIHNNRSWDPSTWNPAARGWGSMEAPRGALGHWVSIDNGVIENYQAVVPTTWNGSPRDAKGQMGPFEAALIGTPIADPHQPLEVLRTIHSFDPCLACAVHLLDLSGQPIDNIRVL